MIDSGSPPMSSTSTLTVVIGDRNDHPHSPGHTHFIVYSFEGVLPTTALGQVQSPDLDDWSEKVFRFEGQPTSAARALVWFDEARLHADTLKENLIALPDTSSSNETPPRRNERDDREQRHRSRENYHRSS
ncbi:unnamed protein product [Pleuronectes platessa]|uniref:Uncharacterized protein n=1 Tax=Pleuronectes platessa TaxID=8262 RepID=A0A9N7Y751_PLEPL|nr:unnamed protein product [Pleuronectes platessa]